MTQLAPINQRRPDDIARRLEGAHNFERLNAPQMRRDRWHDVLHWALVVGLLAFIGVAVWAVM